MTRYIKLGKICNWKIRQGKIKLDLARYDKVRFGKIWQDVTR